jgi:acyl phosphate:glycerol-3-phosphate acyltransferase
MHTIVMILSIILAYLLGSVPFGVLFTRLFSHVDVRSVGSGNIGATNVLRAAGKKAAILTLLADAFKGLIPVLIIKTLFQDDVVTVLSGAAAILGHNFPVYLKFKGGKGVATSYGVILAVAPWIGLACLVIWLVTAYLFRYSSLAALVSFACYPLLTLFTNSPPSKPHVLLSLFIFGLIYYRHRENIKRLLAGAEPKIGNK